MTWFPLLTLVAFGVVVLSALARRGRAFAVFVSVLVGIYSLLACAMAPSAGPLLWVFTAFHMAVYANFVLLSRPRMRSLPFRLLLSWPSAVMVAGTLLSLPWAIAIALHFHPWVPWLPYALAAIGLFQSLSTRRETVDLVIPGPTGRRAANGPAGLLVPANPDRPRTVIPHPRGTHRQARPLTIVQITDPHLGPFMSVARLRAIAARAVEAEPDLVFLTGDFLTMESQNDPDLLLEALRPLQALRGRVFACLGNHDLEAQDIVERALRENGIELLVDASTEIETAAGLVQIVGMNFVWRDRPAHLARVSAAHPRQGEALRIVLLHDPGAFQHLPEATGDLVLSGHTHGGQVGLVSLGLSFTMLRLFGIRIPDHGFWARGTDRMYVHKGTGHYGFPLRLGVPAEEGLIRIHRL
jgi:predicted MPP superfamily phosphohydrolase